MLSKVKVMDKLMSLQVETSPVIELLDPEVVVTLEERSWLELMSGVVSSPNTCPGLLAVICFEGASARFLLLEVVIFATTLKFTAESKKEN